MVFMTRVEPFGKVAETFASQRETWFSVRFRQAFITSLFQAFQKAVKSLPAVNEIGSPSPLQSRTPKEGSNTPCSNRYVYDFVVDCDKTTNSRIEPAFIELEGKRTNHYTGRGYTRWDRWFVKSFLTSIVRE
ncbi:hypothetical protein AVEN_29474-1 [Araneus ventricosus]|uniref:Uncharacterized protein n=1 Tax=Araneus ventricosus TaxID=182803 RepID=A0A4Y2VB74_ARAVE|nr:hypothetical protein AVEN_29474-1 [Araneus ventricosus]